MPQPSQPEDVQRAQSPAAVSVGVATEDFIRRLGDEYKMLQDKIDKIGAFRFTIKGWSVTAVIAASAASSNAKSLITILTVSSGLAIMVAFFFWIELEQVKLSRLFGDRARRLENAFVRIDRKRGELAKLPFPVPFTVNEIAFAGARRRVLHSGRLNQIEDPLPLSRRLADGWRLWRRTHVFFYMVLLLLAFAPLLPRHLDISRHWSALIERTAAAQPRSASPAPAQQPGPGKTNLP